MTHKTYITDFCEDLNYQGVVLYVDSEIDLEDLLNHLKAANVSHLYRFDCVRENRLFYIENCDLQDVTIDSNQNELLDLLENDYSIFELKKDNAGFYIKVSNLFF